MSKDLNKETIYLFSGNCYDDIDEDAFIDHASKLIATYGWDKVFASWENYLYENCKTPEEVINFANWYFIYNGYDYKIDHPYKFLAYFYYRLDMKVIKYDIDSVMDSIVIDTLLNCGYDYVDWVKHEDYVPERDPKIIEEVEKWRRGEYK